MDTDLKRVIDVNHTDWDELTTNEALDIVSGFVNEVGNPVVYREKFHRMVQQEGETIREFITKIRICALDCAFVCPYDESHYLTDHHLVNRIRAIVRHGILQQEVL